MRTFIVLLSALLATSCTSVHLDESSPPEEPGHAHRPPPGSNLMLRAPITVVGDLEVLISDVVIPAGATVPRHYHSGEEFVYVLEGSAVHVEESKPDRVLKAGDSYVIAPGAIHAPRAGPEGARAVVFRVHISGAEERILVD